MPRARPRRNGVLHPTRRRRPSALSWCVPSASCGQRARAPLPGGPSAHSDHDRGQRDARQEEVQAMAARAIPHADWPRRRRPHAVHAAPMLPARWLEPPRACCASAGRRRSARSPRRARPGRRRAPGPRRRRRSSRARAPGRPGCSPPGTSCARPPPPDAGGHARRTRPAAGPGGAARRRRARPDQLLGQRLARLPLGRPRPDPHPRQGHRRRAGGAPAGAAQRRHLRRDDRRLGRQVRLQPPAPQRRATRG